MVSTTPAFAHAAEAGVGSLSRRAHAPHAGAGHDASSAVDARALRLALFSDTWAPQVNGVSRTLERLRDAVVARGGTVHVFTGDDPRAVHAEGVSRSSSVPFWAYPQLQLAWPDRGVVARTLRAFQPTLVHVATEFGVGLAGRSVSRSLGVPMVTSYHTSFASYAQYYRLGLLARPGWRYLRWFHRAGARTFCPTQAIVREVEAQGFTNCAVWSRGVDVQRFSPQHRDASLRETMGVDDDVLVVGYVGRLAAEKGLGTALDAMHIAAQARPGRVAFMVVGDGPFESQMHARTPEPRWLPGALHGPSLSAAYASADVFLFPSTTDTFGNVLLEAMASGLPIIGADVGPTRELVGDSRGWLVERDRADALAAAIIACVDDPASRRERAARAREFAERSTWDRVWDGLIADYLRVHRPVSSTPTRVSAPAS
jgi:phosphatidylinositol alpha 1,6-mannosyltransferase